MVQENQAIQKELIEKYDEGLGTVYERFRLNYIFERLISKWDIKKTLEFPLYGMTGVDGINSVYFAQQNIDVELVDTDQERLEQVKSYWKLLGLDHKLTSHYCSQRQ